MPRNISNKWDIPWYTTSEHCITILYRALENTVANTVSMTILHMAHDGKVLIPLNTPWLLCIRIGCIFSGMVYM